MGTLKVDTVTNVAGSGAPNATAVTVDNVALSSIPQMEYVASASAPTSPSVGSLWYSTTSDAFYMWDGTQWNTITFTPPPPAFFGSRGIFTPGQQSAFPTVFANVLDYVTIASSGNATDFGDLTSSGTGTSAVSNGTRGCITLGQDTSFGFRNGIDYITISTPGNGTDFGDLTSVRGFTIGVHGTTRGLFGGGYESGYSQSNIIVSIYGLATKEQICCERICRKPKPVFYLPLCTL